MPIRIANQLTQQKKNTLDKLDRQALDSCDDGFCSGNAFVPTLQRCEDNVRIIIIFSADQQLLGIEYFHIFAHHQLNESFLRSPYYRVTTLTLAHKFAHGNTPVGYRSL